MKIWEIAVLSFVAVFVVLPLVVGFFVWIFSSGFES